jgi:uncharacterized protein involved in outer membrane biogenesis
MKATRIVIAVLSAVAALLVIAAVLVAAFFDPNDYKGVVTDAFAARTGRSLAIERDLELSFFPWLAVETGGITVGNAPGFGGDGAPGSAPFATIERAAARVKLLPLVRGRVEIGTVELDGLRLNLARDAQLRGNWQDLADAAAPQSDAAAVGPVEPGGVTADSFALEGVRIRKGTVLWHENTNVLRYTVSNLDLSTGEIGSRSPVDLDVALTFRNEITATTADLRASATVQLARDGGVGARNFEAAVKQSAGPGAPPRELHARAATLAFDPQAQTLAVEGLTTESAGVHAAWTLAGKTLLDNPTIEGSVNVVGAPLAGVFDELGWQPPEGVAKGELGDLTMSSGFSFRSEPREVRVTKLQAKLLGLELSGEGTLAGDELRGNVAIPEFGPTPAVRALLRAAVPPRVDVSALDKLALTTHFDANVATGRAALTNIKAGVFGATISGNLEALPGERGNSFRGSISTSRFAPDAFAKAFAAMLPQTIQVKELGMMRLEARFALDTEADSVTVAPFEAELFGLAATGEAAGRGISKTATWTGRAHVAQFSPQDLIRRFGLPAQPTSDPKALTRATIDTRFVVDAQQARFSDLVLQLDESQITGDFTVVGRDKPAYRFALAIDGVDADRYLPPNAREAKEGEPTAGDIKLPENNTMQLDGTMQIADLRLAGMQFNDVASRILIGNGDAKLEGARARLYGGTFNGNFLVRAAGDTPGLALDGKASGLQLQPLIQALTGEPANLSGAGSFELNLAGRGRAVIDNVQTAGGNVAFELSNGAIKGFNLGALLCTAYNALQGAPGPRGEVPKVTAFEAIKGTATVASGQAHSTDLLARTSFMDIYGRGTLGLVEQSLDYDIDAKLTGKVALPNCETLDEQIGESIPFKLEGTVTEPKPSFDFSKFLRRKARETLQDRILRSILK